jgi:ABC-type phosphate transport system substrate-binding protein
MRRAAVILCTLLFVTPAAPIPAAEPVLAVIVHPDRASVRFTREQLRTIYLKQRRFWDDGTPIVALNREPGSAQRELFSQRVLDAASADLAAYWNEQYFDGVFPPPTLSSGTAVKRYVAADRNAIGYVEVHDLDDSVHVILRLE